MIKKKTLSIFIFFVLQVFLLDALGASKKVDKNKPDYVGLVLFNYVKSFIENKEYEINLLNSNLEKYKGKVWNICLINMLNECYKPSMEIEVLNNRILEGGIKLSLWETKE